MKKKIKRVRSFLLWIIILMIIGILVVVGIGMFSVRYVLVSKNKDQVIENDVSIITDDGVKLAASENIISSETHHWAILVHSYRTDRSFMKSYARKYREKGYNTISPDNRAHGSSGGKYIGMGYLDQYDIWCWIAYILEKDQEAEIVLHGISMGGAALMMLSGQENLPKNIKAIIEDCGYTSVKDYLTWKLKQKFKLPAFPIIPIANVAFKFTAGYYMQEASALEGVKKSSIPTLFIHGTADRTVPVEEVYRLYESATCPKELYIVEDAGHGEALWKNEDEYWKKVFTFIDEQGYK